MSTRNPPETRTTSDNPGYRNTVGRPPINQASRCWLLLVGATVLMICLRFIHFVFGLGDEGVLLHGAQRLLQGQRLYVDFFEFLPPGGFVIVTAWFSIAGVSL